MKNKKINIIIPMVAVCLFAMATAAGSLFLIQRINLKKTGNVLGVSWYNETDKEFTIKTKEELMEISRLSDYYTFEGQTIYLGADIVLNEGNAEEWRDQMPESTWSPISNFAGTFDGHGHTISGLYAKSYNASMALFAKTSRKAIVKDLSLVNSYFNTRGAKGTASFVSNGGGKFSGLYSDAIFEHTGKRCGGIASSIDEQAVFEECWFDGKIYVRDTLVGGIIDVVESPRVELSHSLFSGEIEQQESYNSAKTGGICGQVATGGALTVKDCLSSGRITSKIDIQIASVIGSIESSSNTLFENSYASLGTYDKTFAAIFGSYEGNVVAYEEERLMGTKAYQWTGLDYEKYWTIVESGTPILKRYAETIPSVDGLKKAYDISWYDETRSTFVLDSKEDLYGLWYLSHSMDFKGKTIKLGADIVVNEGLAKDWGKNAPENRWWPIGAYINYTTAFAGTFDGQGHSISGIYLKEDREMDTYSGFFGMTALGSKIQNFRLKNSYFERTGHQYAFMGSIAGEARGTVNTVYSDAIIKTSGTMAGGLIGRFNNTDSKAKKAITIQNGWFDGQLIGIDRGRELGGIVGIVMKTASVPNGIPIEIINCLNTGTISCERKDIAAGEEAQFIGGIVGRDNYSAVSLNITSCLNTGKIIVPKENQVGVGSILGSVHSPKCIATVRNTYTTRESYIDNSGIPVAVDVPKGYFKGDLKNSVIVLPEESLTGVKAYQWTALDFTNHWSVTKNDAPELKAFATETVSTKNVKKIVDTSWYREDKASYTIDSAADLYGLWILAHDLDFKEKTINVGADITVNTGDAKTWGENAPAIPWYPISVNDYRIFEGTFNGNGHTISGLYYSDNSPIKSYGGLFGIVGNESSICNIKLTNSYFERTGYQHAFMGSIVGEMRGNIDTVYSDAILVTSGTQTGGIVGRTSSNDPDGKQELTINNCWFAGEIKGIDRGREIGGIVGVLNKTVGGKDGSIVNITNCLFTGNISCERKDIAKDEEAQFIGGIIGRDNYAKLTIKMKDCMSNGKIVVPKTNEVGVGSVVGSIHRKGCVVNMVHVYTTEECYKNHAGSVVAVDTPKGYYGGTLENGAIVFPKDMLIGIKGYQWTELDFANYWASISTDTPILKSFASDTLSLAGITRKIDTTWYDQAKEEYTIDSAEELYGLWSLSQGENFKGKTIKLGADIEVNKGNAESFGTTAPENPWYPIGNINNPFAGTFDGQGHTISGIYLSNDSTSEEYSGLFGVTLLGSKIQNLRLENSYFERTGYQYAFMGSVIGEMRGAIDSVYSDAILTSDGSMIGGIVGRTNNNDASGKTTRTINNCWFDGEIIGTGRAHQMGGITAVAMKTSSAPNGAKIEIANCLNTGTISCERKDIAKGEEAQFIGGIIGRDNWAAIDLTIKGCLNSGKIIVPTQNQVGVGSIMGSVHGTKCVVRVSDTYATKESYVNKNGKPVAIDSPADYSFGTLRGNVGLESQNTLTGFGGYQNTKLDFDKYWTVVKNSTPTLLSFTTETAELSEMIIPDTSWYHKSTGIVNAMTNDPYILKDASDLYGFAQLAKEDTFEGKTIILAKDIIVNSGNSGNWETMKPANNWYPIGSHACQFAGTFDGQGHTISGICMYDNQGFESYSGLFGFTEIGSMIRNLRLTNSYFERTDYAYSFMGSVVGEMQGSMDTVYSDAIMKADCIQTGGLVGRVNYEVGSNKPITINNCWFDGEIRAVGRGREVGGIAAVAGESTSGKGEGIVNITNSLFSGQISCERADIASGEEPQFIGGIIGRDNWAKIKINITSCLSTGKITVPSTNQSGVGSIMGAAQRAGCEVTISNTCSLEDCFKNNGTEVMVGTPTGHSSGKITWGTVSSFAQSDLIGYWGYANLKTTVGLNLYTYATPDGAFVMKENSMPELASFSEHWLDFGWYYNNRNAKEFTIHTAEEFYSLPIIVNGNYQKCAGFSGDTIYLANDIVLNEGKVEDWIAGKVDGVRNWTPIGIMATDKKFGGTFDGQGHTISGLYFLNESATTSYSGLFGVTDLGTIKNVKLTNSYLKRTCSQANLGSILGYMSGGQLDSVYSDAYVTTNGIQVGGLIGKAEYIPNSKWNTTKDKNVYINNCWFDGEILANGQNSIDIGGIVGCVLQGSNGSLARTSNLEGVFNITNCLNSGKITNLGTVGSADDNGAQFVGGIIGRDLWCKVTTNITNCLNVGEIIVPETNQKAVGSIMGAAQRSGSVVNITNTYATKESYKNKAGISVALGTENTSGTVNGLVTLVERAEMLGDKATTQTGCPNLFEASSSWEIDSVINDTNRGTPILKTFATWWKKNR